MYRPSPTRLQTQLTEIEFRLHLQLIDKIYSLWRKPLTLIQTIDAIFILCVNFQHNHHVCLCIDLYHLQNDTNDIRSHKRFMLHHLYPFGSSGYSALINIPLFQLVYKTEVYYENNKDWANIPGQATFLYLVFKVKKAAWIPPRGNTYKKHTLMHYLLW